MFTKLLFIIAIIVQTVAIFLAVRHIHSTKYNAIWILFIISFITLSAERLMQFLSYNGGEIPTKTLYYTGFVVSIGLSIGVMYAHKLILHIDRLNHQRTLTSKRILTAVLRAEERSRSRFSKDLHDGLGPLISSAKMSLSALERAQSDDERREIYNHTTYAIDEAIRSLREISNNMSPQILSDFGLSRALSNFITKSASLHATKIDYRCTLASCRYHTDVEVVMYRVICELINNSLKHANCKKITLELSHNEESLHLLYRDNGVGFDPEAMLDCGMGLSNITSRINSLNGTIEITSAPNRGMRTIIDVAAKPIV